MTDEQFKQLMAKLEEILQRLPGAPQPAPLLPGQCYLCRGYHYGSSICPQLRGIGGVAQGH